MKRKMNDSTVGYLFILPMVIVMIIIAIPLIQSVWMSFSDYYLLSGSRTHAFIGLENFRSVIGQTHFWKMTRVTAYYTLYSVAGKMVLGLLVALLLNSKIKGKGFVRSLIVIPWAMPGIVVAMLFTLALDPAYGMLNYLLEKTHLITQGIPFLSDVDLALPVVVTIGIWKNFPFTALMLLASLQGISPELYEAGRIDGANTWQQFRFITWPMILPVWLIMLILQIVGTIKEFDLIYLVTRGGPDLATNVIGLDIYRNAFKFFKLGVASAEGMMLMVICFVFAIVYYRYELRNG
jgi:multiple sugar transport system permease protein